MIRGITWTHIQSIWNHSGPSEVPYSANQYSNWSGTFFAVSYSKPALLPTYILTFKSVSHFAAFSKISHKEFLTYF